MEQFGFCFDQQKISFMTLKSYFRDSVHKINLRRFKVHRCLKPTHVCLKTSYRPSLPYNFESKRK